MASKQIPGHPAIFDLQVCIIIIFIIIIIIIIII